MLHSSEREIWIYVIQHNLQIVIRNIPQHLEGVWNDDSKPSAESGLMIITLLFGTCYERRVSFLGGWGQFQHRT